MTARYVAAEHDGRQYMTTAVPLVAHDSDDETWLAARRNGIGASEIASVCGTPGAFSSPFALYWAKRLGWETERTFAMKVGSKLEETIGELFAEEYPGVTLVRPSWRLYQHPTHAWMLASPDFLAVEFCEICGARGWLIDAACPNCLGDGGWVEPVECKSDEGRKWDEAPPKHLMQLWQQILVFGAPRGHLVRLHGKRLSAYIVDPDAGATEMILRRGEEFATMLRLGITPDVDAHKETEAALIRLYPPVADDDPAAAAHLPPELLDEFARAHAARAAALEAFDAVRNRVRLAMGDARWAIAPDGGRFIEHRKYKRGGYEVGPCEVDEIRKAW